MNNDKRRNKLVEIAGNINLYLGKGGWGGWGNGRLIYWVKKSSKIADGCKKNENMSFKLIIVRSRKTIFGYVGNSEKWRIALSSTNEYDLYVFFVIFKQYL